MKKIFSYAAIFLSLLFSLSGCSFSGNGTVYPQTSYSLIASVDDNGEESKLSIHHTGGDFRITYTEPESLKGFEEYYTMDENGEWQSELKYSELCVPISDISLLESSVGNGIVASLKDAQIKNKREVSGITTEGSYTLKFDSDGYPVKLTMPQQDLTVTFKKE